MPYKLVWVYNPPMEPKRAETRLFQAAKKLLNEVEICHMELHSDNKQASLSCCLEQPREELLKLLAMNESSGFITCMVDHFEWMAKFTSVVDEIVKAGKPSRR